MKKIVLSNAVTGNLHEFSLNDLDQMQDGYSEAIASLLKGLVPDPTQLVILHGCGIVKVSTTYTLSPGAIAYNGEVYQVDAQVLTSGSTVNWEIITSYPTDDPVIYSGGPAYNVHKIDKLHLVAGSGIAQWDHTRKLEWVQWNKLHDIGDIALKMIDTSDFDGSGLGKTYSKWEGWAYMNGSNGTVDMGGFFPVGQKTSDADYDNLADTGGEKTHALSIAEMPRHSHPYKDIGDTGSGGIATGGAASQVDQNRNTSWVGGDGTQSDGPGIAHENRPPFKTVRFIQKVA